MPVVVVSSQEIHVKGDSAVLSLDNESSADAVFAFSGADAAALQLPPREAAALPPAPLPMWLSIHPMAGRVPAGNARTCASLSRRRLRGWR